MIVYPAVFTAAEEGGFVITFPDVPEAITQADTKEEGLVAARDCLETALSFYIEQRKSLPKASSIRGKVGISVSSMTAMKLMIHQGMIDKDIRKADLARMIGIFPPQVERLLDPMHASKLDQIEKALAALGLTLVVDVKKAA